MGARRRPPSPTAIRAAQLKQRCKDLGVPNVHVTSDRYSRTITVKWTDGPTKQALQKMIGPLQTRVVWKRWTSNAAAMEAIRLHSRYERVQRWLEQTDLSQLSDWALAASDVLDVEPASAAASSPWARMRRVSEACATADADALRIVVQLRREGSLAPLAELVAVAKTLQAD